MGSKSKSSQSSSSSSRVTTTTSTDNRVLGDGAVSNTNAAELTVGKGSSTGAITIESTSTDHGAVQSALTLADNIARSGNERLGQAIEQVGESLDSTLEFALSDKSPDGGLGAQNIQIAIYAAAAIAAAYIFKRG